MESVVYPLVGGIIVGVSSSFMLWGLGRITGISGIIAGSMGKFKAENMWRYLFLIGLVLGGVILKLLDPSLFSYSLKFSITEIVVAGLLVGYGTRLGSGCTSGHGVCGIPRLSKRSIAATAIFMSFGILTVALKGVFL